LDQIVVAALPPSTRAVVTLSHDLHLKGEQLLDEVVAFGRAASTFSQRGLQDFYRAKSLEHLIACPAFI
jgi:hypothetical protein